MSHSLLTEKSANLSFKLHVNSFDSIYLKVLNSGKIFLHSNKLRKIQTFKESSYLKTCSYLQKYKIGFKIIKIKNIFDLFPLQGSHCRKVLHEDFLKVYFKHEKQAQELDYSTTYITFSTMNTVYIEQMKCTLGFKVTHNTEHLYTYCLEHISTLNAQSQNTQ